MRAAASAAGPWLGSDASRLGPIRARVSAFALAAALAMELGKAAVRWNASFLPVLGCAVGALLVLSQRYAPVGAALLAATALWCAGTTFPATPNHAFALAIGLLLCAWALLARRQRTQPGPERLLRWLAFAIVFWSGGQKLLHGTYLHGEFLAAKLAAGEARWNWFALLLDPRELAELRAPDYLGPLVLTSWLPLLASRSIPVVELFGALSLLRPAWRRSSAIGLLMLMIFLQATAGEFTFALAMSALLAAFLEVRTALHLGRVAWLAAAVFVSFVAVFPRIFN